MRKTSLLLAFILLVSFTATAEMAGPGHDAEPRSSTSGGNVTTPSLVTPSSLPTQSKQHTVRSGDTLWDLSLQYKVPLADLLTANQLAPNSVLSVGQVLQIPTASTNSTARQPASSNSPSGANAAPAGTANVRYRVQRGNTLWDIAVAYGVTVEAVMQANRLNKDSILAVGQEVVIPAPKRTPAASELAPQAPAPPAAAPPAIQMASASASSEVTATQALSETVSFEAPPEIVVAEAQASAPITETAPVQVAEAPVLEAAPDALLVFSLINEKRAGHGLAPLVWSPVLAQAAQAHAEDCERRDFGSHVGSDGARLRDRLARVGYHPTAASENWVYSYGPQRGVDWWYNEPPGRDPHRRNILSNQYAEVGVGIIRDESGLYYIVADFGRS